MNTETEQTGKETSSCEDSIARWRSTKDAVIGHLDDRAAYGVVVVHDDGHVSWGGSFAYDHSKMQGLIGKLAEILKDARHFDKVIRPKYEDED